MNNMTNNLTLHHWFCKPLQLDAALAQQCKLLFTHYAPHQHMQIQSKKQNQQNQIIEMPKSNRAVSNIMHSNKESTEDAKRAEKVWVNMIVS